jgi:hypothetical protein
MNAELISYISEYQNASSNKAVAETKRKEIEEKSGMKFYYEEDVVFAFYKFLCQCGAVEEIVDAQYTGNPNFVIVDGKTFPPMMSNMKPVHITCAGKNFGTFDKVFLERLPRWQQAIRIRQRILDPSIFFIDWEHDKEMPSLSVCKQRANMGHIVTHNAIEDAWDVVMLLRTVQSRNQKPGGYQTEEINTTHK